MASKNLLENTCGKAMICKKNMSHFPNRQKDQGISFRILQRARLMTFYKDAISINCSLKTLHHYPANHRIYSGMALTTGKM
jgi:hypothetical protein